MKVLLRDGPKDGQIVVLAEGVVTLIASGGYYANSGWWRDKIPVYLFHPLAKQEEDGA